jgi:hypothetical protein
VEAIDAAEEEFSSEEGAVAGEAVAEIFYNSDPEPHYRLFLLEPEREGQSHFGLFNTGVAKWEVIYPPGYGENLEAPPPWFTEDTGEGATKDDQNEQEETDEGEHKKDDDADTMDLGGEDDDDEDEMDDDESDGDDGEDESEEDDEGESEKGDNEDSDSEHEEDAEMPRLTFFSKMRGPKGWRKRAESDPERDFNRFEFVVGVLDEDHSRPAGQEHDRRVHVRFTERDDTRDNAELRVRVPEGAVWKYDEKGRWFVFEIPTIDEEE